MVYLYFLCFSFFLELLYLKIAAHYNIIDKPNHRSSHTQITIRGGGIIFVLAMLTAPLFFGLRFPLFLSGLLIVTLISFLDDLKPVKNTVRIFFHLAAGIMLIIQLNVSAWPMYFCFVALLFVIGAINAINFMDGINGITGFYSLVALSTLAYVNIGIQFTDKNYLLASIIAVMVFNFFNFRTKAKCFAGDVGSVGIAFIIMFFLLQLILKTLNIGWLLILLVYGLDTFTTILFRAVRGERITEAHRSHFYQYLVNERHLPHLLTATLYALTQLLINIAVINMTDYNPLNFIIFAIISLSAFLGLRFYTEGKQRLLVG